MSLGNYRIRRAHTVFNGPQTPVDGRVLPWTARLDVQRTDAGLLQVTANRVRDELRTVVATDVAGHTPEPARTVVFVWIASSAERT